MATQANHEQEQQVEKIVAEYLQAIENGRNPDPNKLIRDNPQFSSELTQFFRMCHEVDSLARAGSAQGLDESQPKRLGDFRIVREISRGGMKIVYEAVQDPLDRRVAVATIGRGRVLPQYRDRFLHEQRVLARLHQTHIVPIFAAGADGPIQYFAMPYIHGAALHEIVKTARDLETARLGSTMPSLQELAKRVLDNRGDLVAASSPLEAGTGQRSPGLAGLAHRLFSARHQSPTLSGEYFRSVASVMADVAQSLQYAHEHAIFHRDLKPSNIMVDTEGQSWLIDFGLAGCLQRPGSLHVAGQPGDLEDPLTLDHDVPGTVGYMAPEQEEKGGHDVRIDVWGLGVTLYELLTLRRAFAGRPATQPGAPGKFSPPLPPHKHVSNIPRDLEAICMKALQEAPGSRYQTAREFAEDLNRWLHGEPTVAHPAQAPRRAYLWARRNKGWALAIAASMLALLAFAIGAFRFEQARAGASEARAQAEARESLMLKVEGLLRPGQSEGWSATAWDLERRIVKLGRDHRMRDQATAILGGLDARKLKHSEDFGATNAVFDLSGTRLLASTVTDPGKRFEKTQLWNLDTYEVQDLKAVANGPVGFRPNGTPLQLAARQKDLVLLDPARGDVVLRLDLPQGAIVCSPELAAMTRTGSFVAAMLTSADGNSMLVAWDGASGKRLAQFPFSGKASALELSPDGTLIATGREDGVIEVWSISSASEVASLQARRIGIHALAFDRDRRRAAAPAGAAAHGWLLAAGDAGGTVTIWDLGSKIPRSYCRGNHYDVCAVAFSPDGATLASSGHGPAKLWDLATGSLLLNLNAGGITCCLAFSPDGRKLAVGSVDLASPSVGQLSVWSLEPARGLERLHGLEGQVAKVCFSHDGRLLAALGHNWEVAIWDLPNGFLRHVLAVPQGLTADNSAMAFSPDGRRFAFTAGREARSWDVGSGDELNLWELNEGFVDVLAYAGPDKLLSLRVEAQDGKRSPYDMREGNPLVCRLRQLPDRGVARVIKEIPDFNWHVYTAATPSTGQYFVVDGLAGPRGERRMIKVFDETGKEIMPIPTTRTHEQRYGWMLFDPTGRLLAAVVGQADGVALLEMPSGKLVGQFDVNACCLAPGGKYWAYIGQPATQEWPEGSVQGVSLFRGGEKEAVVVFDIDSRVQSAQIQFDATGTLFAWGRTDGTVAVCNIPEVRRRLAELGLDW
ncbi:MAG: protein kinase domain-containing protein [Thermoguttaceae bacterium]